MKFVTIAFLFAIVIAYVSGEDSTSFVPRQYYGLIKDNENGEQFEIERPEDSLNAASCYEDGSGVYSPISCNAKCQESKHPGGFCRDNVCICRNA